MSMLLEIDTKPKGTQAKTVPFDQSWNDGITKLHLGDIEIGMEDFKYLVFYVLTNTDLLDKDPRLDIVEGIKKLKLVDGFNSSKKRFEIKEDN